MRKRRLPTLGVGAAAVVASGGGALARRASLAMAQFAAGASQVLPIHELAQPFETCAHAAAIGALPMKPLLTKAVSAHVMGGYAAGAREGNGVVRPDGLYWQLARLSVHEGSVFPTSIGANPQVPIHGLVNRLAQGLARQLGAREVVLA